MGMLTQPTQPWVRPPLSPAAATRRAALAVLTFSAIVSASETLPYVPTTILIPGSRAVAWPNGTNNSSVAYIFSPSDQSVDLLALDISATLKAGSISAKTLASKLPFADGAGQKAFAPSISDNGTITVFAGECASPTTSELWSYSPPSSTSAGAEWIKHETTESGGATGGQAAPYFLGGSLSFSSQIAPSVSPPITYVYGGMCPWANTTGSTPQSGAMYSRRMLKVTPPTSDSDSSFTVGATSSSSQPPVAEAGFTFTGLTPAISSRLGTVTQETSYVVLGGHTQQAFVNMSTAAIWSLPEETWNFVTIKSPETKSGQTELAIKDIVSGIDSRSGHTAVLSEDGNSLIILGGWVGETTQAASPQLAIIEVGSSLDEWQWFVPAAQPAGTGIYGHGAALLPGNVMMVYGGYTISASNAKQKRQAGASGDVQMFFNLTSQTWSNDYTNPLPSSSGSTSSGSSGADVDDSARNRQIGLGVGLGLGIPLILTAFVLAALWYRRHQNAKRFKRESDLRSLAQDASRFLHESGDGHGDDEMTERDDAADSFFPWNASAARSWYADGHDPYQSGGRSLGYESLRGGSKAYPMPPGPAAPVGRPRNARGLYQPTTSSTNTYDFRPLRIPGRIHPIYEADEDEHIGNDNEHGGDLGVSGVLMSPDTEEDPFMTPAGGTPTGQPFGGLFPPPSSSSRESGTPTPEANTKPRGQDREVRDWVCDVDVADAVLAARISPHNATTTRTSIVTTPISPTTAGSLLTTTAATGITPPLLSAVPAPLNINRHGRTSPTRRSTARGGGAGTTTDADVDDGRTASNLSESAYSFVQGGAGTATTRSDSVRSHFRNAFGGPTITTVAAPGISAAATEARLDSSSSSERTYSTARSKPDFSTLQAQGPSLLHGEAPAPVLEEDDEEDFVHIPGSPSKNKPRRSWFGSLKRVFSGGTATPTPTGSSRGDSPTHDEGGSSDFEPRLVGMGPGGRLLRRKQGREAWEAAAARDVGTTATENEDDWDIERAVEQRLVQVMFTVPKERLRVVNADMEREEEAIVIDPEQEGFDVAEAYEKHYENPGGAQDLEKMVLRDEAYMEDMDENGKGKEVDELLDVDTDVEVAPSERTDSMNTATIYTAEAIRLERRRTKVLEMVESIESRSRDNSPASSPQRSR